MKKYNLVIEPLSKKNLNEAIALVLEEFENKPYEVDYPPKWFKASLSRQDVKYFVGIDSKSKKLIGTTGYYLMPEDSEDSAWLGWFCVDEKYRGKGIGTQLLDFTINKVKILGKKKFKLYTSTDSSEAAAQLLYEKKGFVKIGEEVIRGKPYKKVYRELIF